MATPGGASKAPRMTRTWRALKRTDVRSYHVRPDLPAWPPNEQMTPFNRPPPPLGSPRSGMLDPNRGRWQGVKAGALAANIELQSRAIDWAAGESQVCPLLRQPDRVAALRALGL